MNDRQSIPLPSTQSNSTESGRIHTDHDAAIALHHPYANTMHTIVSHRMALILFNAKRNQKKNPQNEREREGGRENATPFPNYSLTCSFTIVLLLPHRNTNVMFMFIFILYFHNRLCFSSLHYSTYAINAAFLNSFQKCFSGCHSLC